MESVQHVPDVAVRAAHLFRSLVDVLLGDVLVECLEVGAFDGVALLARELGRRRDVVAVLADRRQNLRRHPLLERLRLRLAALHDQTVQTRLVNEGGFLLPAEGVGNADPTPLVLIQTTEGVLMIGNSQNLANILAHKPRLALDYHIANRPEIRVLENT